MKRIVYLCRVLTGEHALWRVSSAMARIVAAEWKEEDHPRRDDGRFGTGGGGGTGDVGEEGGGTNLYPGIGEAKVQELYDAYDLPVKTSGKYDGVESFSEGPVDKKSVVNDLVDELALEDGLNNEQRRSIISQVENDIDLYNRAMQESDLRAVEPREVVVGSIAPDADDTEAPSLSPEEYSTMDPIIVEAVGDKLEVLDGLHRLSGLVSWAAENSVSLDDLKIKVADVSKFDDTTKSNASDGFGGSRHVESVDRIQRAYRSKDS